MSYRNQIRAKRRRLKGQRRRAYLNREATFEALPVDEQVRRILKLVFGGT